MNRQQLARRRRREWLLTFSPGEWIWLVAALAVMGLLILA
jgi:hypothetical protein